MRLLFDKDEAEKLFDAGYGDVAMQMVAIGLSVIQGTPIPADPEQRLALGKQNVVRVVALLDQAVRDHRANNTASEREIEFLERSARMLEDLNSCALP